MGRQNVSSPAVDAFRYEVGETIKLLPPNPPENPYHVQIGTPVSHGFDSPEQTAEGKVSFPRSYAQRRVWLPGVEIVLAQHMTERTSDFVVNRFRNNEGHGLIARAWYTDRSGPVRRTYSEGPWGAHESPEVSADASLDTVLHLGSILRQLTSAKRSDARQSLLKLAEPLDDVELLGLEEARTAISERQERFRQSAQDRGGFHHLPLYQGEGTERLAGVHTLAVAAYDPNDDDPQIRH